MISETARKISKGRELHGKDSAETCRGDLCHRLVLKTVEDFMT